MNQTAQSGTRGEQVRSDCHVSLELRNSGGVEIQLQSRVESMYGSQIREQIQSVLQQLGVDHARVEMEDTGALPFVIAARLEAAVRQLKSVDKSVLPEMLSANLYETGRDRIRISRLYLPGNTPSLMLNAGIHHPDGIILDLEDSVAPAKKSEARVLVRNALCAVDFYGAERMVRINQLPAGLEDLEEIVPHQVHLILVPKCEKAAEIQLVEERIRTLLADAGQEREIFLMPIIETALGVENSYQIATASSKVVAMAMGLEDYTADLGVKRTPAGEESFYARTRLVNACKAAGIQPIDSVFSDVTDMEGLMENARRSRALGFEGMGCIHPRQIPVIHEGFTPDQEEIEKAKQIIEAYREAETRGAGVTTLGSKMIDLPVVRRAERTLRLATRINQTSL
jgi:citrate lyase subunit beta/citryl-CoA lyase